MNLRASTSSRSKRNRISILALYTWAQKYFGYSNIREFLCRKKKALVVDDEPDARKALVFHLTLHGYECAEVGNAFAAMSWFENNHADLVITDIHQGWCMEEEGRQIPRPTGIELLEYLAKRSGPKPSTMIVVSGNVDYKPTYSDRARKSGAKGFLSKPFKKEELLALI